MLKGTTYIVRPRIAPVYNAVSSLRISAGARQLLFGPASICFSEQMNVRSSTRATSPGSLCAQYELGRFASSSLVKVPAATRSPQSRSYSCCEPSHQCTAAGCKIFVHSLTHACSRLLVECAIVTMLEVPRSG